MRTVAIVNQKGGSGKTTTAITLATILAHRGQRTLLVDVDPQSHCALGFAVPSANIDLSIADALVAGADHQPEPTRLTWQLGKNLDLIPSATKLAGLEAARGGLAEASDREERLLQVLRPLASRYDWCLIDCSPSIGLLTFNALRAASFVLIPVETGYFALRGAERQVGTLEALLRRCGHGASYGVFATMHRSDSRVGQDVLEQIRARFEKCLIPTVVRYDEALREAVSLGVSILDHAPTSTAARDYTALAAWLMEHTPEARMLDAGAVRAMGVDAASDANCTSADDTDDRDAALQPVTARVSVSSNALNGSAPALSRAAELAARARQLSTRSVETQQRVATDERAGAVMRELTGEGPRSTNGTGLSPDQLTSLYGARATSRGVLFVYPAGPDVRVCLAADINGWSPTAHRMSYNPALAAHEICIPFPAGRHPYRFVVNGQWITDPHNPHTAPNPFGQLDSVVEVQRHGRADVQSSPDIRD